MVEAVRVRGKRKKSKDPAVKGFVIKRSPMFTEEESHLFDEERSRIGARNDQDVYEQMVRNGIRVRCRGGRCKRHELWDHQKCYNYCADCGALTEVGS